MGLNYNLGTKMKPIVTSITLAICLMISSAVSADVRLCGRVLPFRLHLFETV
jgi:hypothetical protein